MLRVCGSHNSDPRSWCESLDPFYFIYLNSYLHCYCLAKYINKNLILGNSHGSLSVIMLIYILILCYCLKGR